MLAEFFIDRPIFAWVLSLAIILIGSVAAWFLPIDLYPPITPPTIQVIATYPGANAMTVANTIAAPIEEQVNGVENMLYMSSQSTNDGSYVLAVTFAIGTDPNSDQVLVQNRVALALPQLPAQVQLQGVSVKKTSPNILLAVNLISPDNRYDTLYLSNYATIHVRDKLLRISGITDVMIFGERDYSMRLWLDPDKLSARNLTVTDVADAIRGQNVQVAAGQVGQEPVPKGQQFQLPMNALGRLESVRQFGDIILKTGQGTPATPVVRLRDVGYAEWGAESYDVSNRLDGRPAVGLGVFQLPGSNALQVAQAVKDKMETLKASFPPGLDYRIIYDTTPFIRQSVAEVFRTLLIAVVLVALVVLFFLQDWKAMILPMIDVPVSLVGTFAVMSVLGFSLNNLTLFGLVLVIGIVVDDAIVVLENIERLIATGLDARTATLQAMREITGPIVAITLVLCSVFLPATFIPGLTGQFYRQFAVTIAVAMVISAVNAMTLTPSRAVSIFRTEEHGQLHTPKREALPWWFFAVLGGLLAMWLGQKYFAALLDAAAMRVEAPWRPYLRYAVAIVPGALAGGVIGLLIIRPVNVVLGGIFAAFNRLFNAITRGYGWLIGKLLRLSLIVLVVYAGLLYLTGRVVSRTHRFHPHPRPGIPSAERPVARLRLGSADGKGHGSHPEDRPQHPRCGAHRRHHRAIVPAEHPRLEPRLHVRRTQTVRPAQKPRDVRRRDRPQAPGAVRREVQGALVGVFRAPPIRGLGNAGGFKLQVEQRGFVNLPELQIVTDQLVRRANADPRFMGVFSQFRAATPQLHVDLDRTKIESLQVPLPDVFATLQVFMGGLYVNQLNRFSRTWEVQIQAAPRFRTSPAVLKQFWVRSTTGRMVPLATLARVDDSTGPLVFARYNMYTTAPINGMPAPGTSSGQAIQEMARLADEAHVPFEWTEMAFLQVQAGNVGMLVFVFGTVLVYLVLAAKYESWRLPLAVILVVPLCLLAAVTGMMIARLPIDIFVQIGLLVLVGLASKNAILIVEFARQLHSEGEELHKATVDASHIRFRPIIMTSLAFIFGVLPLVLASGAGAEMRFSLGAAVFSGMIGVTLFGVFLTPVFFFVLLWFTDRRKKR